MRATKFQIDDVVEILEGDLIGVLKPGQRGKVIARKSSLTGRGDDLVIQFDWGESRHPLVNRNEMFLNEDSWKDKLKVVKP